jgi:hypothetical protein
MGSNMDKEFMSIKKGLNEKGYGKTEKDLNGLMKKIYDILFYIVKTTKNLIFKLLNLN